MSIDSLYAPFQKLLAVWQATPNDANAALWAPLVVFGAVVALGMLAAILNTVITRLTFRNASQPPLFGPITYLFAWLPPCLGKSRSALAKELRQAGRYQRHALVNFIAFRNVLVLGTILLAACVAHAASVNAVRDPRLVIGFLGAMVAMVLFSAPRLMLQASAKNRVRRIQTSVPDALDMITMCMTGGLPLLQAIQRVTSELEHSHPDLATELAIVQRHAEAYSLEDAVERFAERIDAPEVRSLATVVSQTERLGANVGAALMDFAGDIRRSFRQRAEERGNRASVKMLLPVALCLAPPVYILLLAPALLELRTFVTRENRPGGVLAPADTSILENSRLSAPRGPS